MQAVRAWPLHEGTCKNCGDHTFVSDGNINSPLCETCEDYFSEEYHCQICNKEMLQSSYKKHLETHSKEELIKLINDVSFECPY